MHPRSAAKYPVILALWDMVLADANGQEFTTSAAIEAQHRNLNAVKEATVARDRAVGQAGQAYAQALRRALSDSMRVQQLEEANRIQAALWRLEDGDEAVNVTDQVRLGLGKEITSGSQWLYDGSLAMRVFEKGIYAADKDGNEFHILLTQPSPRIPTGGDIGRYYDQNGGQQKFGRPLEGDHAFFSGGSYRLHVWSQGVIVWRQRDRRVEAIMLSKPFAIE